MRLIDADALKKEINSQIEQATKVGIRVDADYLWSLWNYAIDNAPTVEFSKEICSACGRYIREKGGTE